MEFLKILALRGPNIWANSPVLEAWVDLKDLKDTSSAMVPGFTDRLMAWLPSLIEHECSEGHRGGFLERLRMGTYPAHILEHVTLELQGQAGTPVGYGRARQTPEAGVYWVVVKYREEAVGRACLEAARALILAALEDRPYDVAAEIARLSDLAERVGLGPSTVAVMEAAKARGIPALRLSRTNSLIQLGHGARQRRMYASATDRTGAIAVSITSDKELTKTLLRTIGVPVPEGQPVEDAEKAWDVACRLGLPVVIKPQRSDNGRGVSVNLKGREQVLAAYAEAREEGPDVLVERAVSGDTYRALVVAGRVVAAARRDVAHVDGDGRSTILELIERLNRDPRRRRVHSPPSLLEIEVGPNTLAVLAEQGYTPDSVPPAGARVRLRRKPMLSNGGTVVDVTDQVHPEVAARVVEAAGVAGLDVAGIDLIVEDIGRPLEEQGGVVIEVNSHPGLQLHLAPWCTNPRPVAEAIVASLFPDGETGRIPVVAVTGVVGTTATTRLIAHLLRRTGLRVGMTCADGLSIGDRRIGPDDGTGAGARHVLMNPTVEVAVLETVRDGILREGLGFDRCAVAVVTDSGAGDHPPGLEDGRPAEHLIKAQRTPVDVVLPTGWAVLNAADPTVAGMAEHCRGGVIYFARDGEHPALREHQAAGRRAAFLRAGEILLAEGMAAEPLIALDRVPMTRDGGRGSRVEDLLAAAAAGWVLGLPREAIVAGLESFDGTTDVAPGRS